MGMRPNDGPVTTNFFEPRPLSKPIDERDHIHGAIDIAAPVNAPIVAPEAGTVFAWAAYRPEPGMYWPEKPVINGSPLPYANYFYDTYGAILILRGSGASHVHVIAHSYANQVVNKGLFQGSYYYEEKADRRFPLHAIYTDRHDVKEGSVIGYVGNAGYSTGSHIHWEIHHGWKWNRWEDRVNPEVWG